MLSVHSAAVARLPPQFSVELFVFVYFLLIIKALEKLLINKVFRSRFRSLYNVAIFYCLIKK
jgi:hypothetical protein